jgi:hypothetical protein
VGRRMLCKCKRIRILNLFTFVYVNAGVAKEDAFFHIGDVCSVG